MTAVPARRPVPQQRARRLSVVPQPRLRAPRTPFVIVVVAILAAGLVGLLLLNTALAQGSFRVHDLQHRTADLQDQQQELQTAVDAANNPARLAAAARRLGLVAAHDPGFLRLSDGRILGAPQAATAPPKKKPSVAPSVKPSVAASTKPAATATTKPTAKPAAKPSTKPAPPPTHGVHR